jgi:outer membrane protein OmpA-like peptidoglycan-associated protein
VNNIYFSLNKSDITKDSEFEVNKMAKLLKKSSTMKIEIQGHTDKVGGDEHNLQLSYERANSVRDFLISKGINRKRIKIKGFGSRKPVASNKTEAGKAKNRRTEFLVLEK